MTQPQLSPTPPDTPAEPAGAAIQLPSLLAALAIMLVGSIYPLLLTGANGQADHPLAMAFFWAMSAGLVRGVGFIPRLWVWRLLFSGWSCVVALLLASWLRFGA